MHYYSYLQWIRFLYIVPMNTSYTWQNHGTVNNTDLNNLCKYMEYILDRYKLDWIKLLKSYLQITQFLNISKIMFFLGMHDHDFSWPIPIPIFSSKQNGRIPWFRYRFFFSFKQQQEIMKRF